MGMMQISTKNARTFQPKHVDLLCYQCKTKRYPLFTITALYSVGILYTRLRTSLGVTV